VEMIFVIVSSAFFGWRVKGKWLHVLAVIYPIGLYFVLQYIYGFSPWNSLVLSGESLLLIYYNGFIAAKLGNK